MRSRIAIFSGYQSPFGRGPVRSGYRARPYTVRPLGPRPGYGAASCGPMGCAPGYGDFGRRGYYVPPIYGPARPGIDRRPRRGYRVKKIKDTPAMKRAQARMKRAAKKCRGKTKGAFRQCMRKALKRK